GEVIERAITAHEGRTHQPVRREIDVLDCDVPEATKICVYRFVQEGLNNAFRHAGGSGQAVAANIDSGKLIVRVTHEVDPDNATTEKAGEQLGLSGLRDRVESLGGGFSFGLADGKAILDMRVNVTPGAGS